MGYYSKKGLLDDTTRSGLCVRAKRYSLVRRKILEGRRIQSLALWPVYPEAGNLPKATFLCNALRGNAKLSSFELAKGYSPSLAGLPQTQTSKETLAAYYEQQ